MWSCCLFDPYWLTLWLDLRYRSLKKSSNMGHSTHIVCVRALTGSRAYFIILFQSSFRFCAIWNVFAFFFFLSKCKCLASEQKSKCSCRFPLFLFFQSSVEGFSVWKQAKRERKKKRNESILYILTVENAVWVSKRLKYFASYEWYCLHEESWQNHVEIGIVTNQNQMEKIVWQFCCIFKSKTPHYFRHSRLLSSLSLFKRSTNSQRMLNKVNDKANWGKLFRWFQ